MKIVVNALLESLIAILNVLIVICMVWVMFAILGNNLMQGKLGYCQVKDDPKFNKYGVGIEACLKTYGGTWETHPANFDDIGQGMVTMYVLSTLEGWPGILGSALDANSSEQGPIFNNSLTNGFFLVFFILLGSLFLMNMVVGVIFVQFSEEQRKEKYARYSMLNDDQIRWIMIQDMLERAKPNFDVMIRPKGKVKIFFFRIIQSKAFEGFIMLCIVMNVILMAMVYQGMSDTYENALNYINLVFTVIFIIEFLMKIYALDFQYFKVSWNIFDFCIVFLSKIDLS